MSLTPSAAMGTPDESEEGSSNTDVERNGPAAVPSNQRVTITQRCAAIVEEFSFLWFTISMNTVSILLHQLPYQFRGSGVLSTILFILNLFLFTVFFFILLLRLVLYPRSVIRICTTNFTELTLSGCVPIAWFTVTAQIGLTASNSSWGGHGFTILAYVMFWQGTAVMVSVAMLVIVVITKTQIIDLASLNPGIVVPFVGTTTNAVVGALIISYSADVSGHLAIPVIIISYLLVGIGVFVALMIYAAYFLKLTNHGLPPPAQSPGLILLVGPCGQSAAALQLLGAAARQHFGAYDKGTFLQSSAGDILATVGVLLGLLFVGLAVFFLAFGIYVILEVAFNKQHKFSLLWNSTIFPTATLNTALISLAIELDSVTFRVLSTVLFLVLMIDYLVIWGFTLYHIFTGRLLNGEKSDSPASKRVKKQ